MRHHGGVVVATVDPVEVVAFHEFAELVVGLFLLVGEYLADAAVGGVGQFDLPVHQFPVDGAPFVEVACVAQRRGDASELGAVVGRVAFGDELSGVDVFLYGKEHLVGVDRFDEVVGDLGADRLVHDVLLLAFGDHDDGGGGTQLLDRRQGFEPRHARHHLVEYDEVVDGGAHHLDRIGTVVACVYLVSLPSQEKNVRLEQIDLVVYPQYPGFVHIVLRLAAPFLVFAEGGRSFRKDKNSSIPC